ncbi:Protein sel-1-like 1 [Durusdinium trenchii]|uniref:Protein sel-1-like 1 n=1 Tax=Durusdinium trenchii TaxID=1381693 RepID=A0ABP0R000_9DINO
MVELDLGAQAALANKVAKGAGGAEAGDGRQGSVYIDDGESALEQDAGEAPAKGPVVSANLISQVFDDPTRTAVFIYKIPQKGYRFVQESITLSSSGKISHLGITMDSATDFSGLTMLSAAPTAEGEGVPSSSSAESVAPRSIAAPLCGLGHGVAHCTRRGGLAIATGNAQVQQQRRRWRVCLRAGRRLKSRRAGCDELLLTMEKRPGELSLLSSLPALRRRVLGLISGDGDQLQKRHATVALGPSKLWTAMPTLAMRLVLEFLEQDDFGWLALCQRETYRAQGPDSLTGLMESVSEERAKQTLPPEFFAILSSKVADVNSGSPKALELQRSSCLQQYVRLVSHFPTHAQLLGRTTATKLKWTSLLRTSQQLWFLNPSSLVSGILPTCEMHSLALRAALLDNPLAQRLIGFPGVHNLDDHFPVPTFEESVFFSALVAPHDPIALTHLATLLSFPNEQQVPPEQTSQVNVIDHEFVHRAYLIGARAGVKDAQINLGSIYMGTFPQFSARTNRFLRNPQLGLYWWHRAAGTAKGVDVQEGRPDELALLNLGYVYGKGDIVPRDDEKAYWYWCRSAEMGNLRACYLRASSLVLGQGVPRDVDLAVQLFFEILQTGAETTDELEIVRLARKMLEHHGIEFPAHVP